MRRDSSCSSGGKTEDSLGRACVGPPRDDAKAHRTWDRGRRSSSSSSSSWGQWAVQLLQCSGSLPWGSGQWNSCNALPHCPWAVGSATPAMHCPTAWGQWAVQLLQCTAPLPRGSGEWNSCNALPHCPGGSGQCNSCNALPHCPGAVGSATPVMHCLTVWGQWAVQLLQCTAPLPGGSGQ